VNRGRRWNRFSTRKRKPRVPTYVLSQLLLTVHSTYRGGLESIFPCSGRVVGNPSFNAITEELPVIRSGWPDTSRLIGTNSQLWAK